MEPHIYIPHPKTDFSKKQKCIAANNPMARVCTTFLFEIKIDIPTIWGRGTPSFRNKITEMCYLYDRRTGPLWSFSSEEPQQKQVLLYSLACFRGCLVADREGYSRGTFGAKGRAFGTLRQR